MRVRKATQRMGAIIDDLLALAKVSRTQLVREQVDLSALAHAIAADLAHIEPARVVEWQIEPGILAFGDPGLLSIENVKYTEDFITEIIDGLEKIERNSRILLLSKYQDQDFGMESSVYREITYNIEHTVHHLAIISIVIPIHFDYIQLPNDFGYAASTIQHLKTQQP
jgi:light-regulated signal transduction histidine kinase (bacteriophytochrome)